MRSMTGLLLAALLVLLGACGGPQPEPLPGSTGADSVAPAVPQGSVTPIAARPTSTAAAESSGLGDRHASALVYIDSVPSGAEVRLLSPDADGDDRSERVLGTTPLAISAAECPGMRFCIWMEMDAYLKKVDAIPELREWARRFELMSHAGSFASSSEWFNFDTPTRLEAQRPGGGLVAIGPVYRLAWPSENRLCALFIPRGVKRAAFYPLMPERLTFPEMKGLWPTLLRAKYGLSDDQLAEAGEFLTRCGKFTALAKDPTRAAASKGRSIGITVQGPGNGTVVTAVSDVWIIPGYND